MRLNEFSLNDYKEITNQNQSVDSIRTFLKSQGYQLLGSGNFSSVWSKSDSRYVFKIGEQGKEDGFIKFVEYIENKKSPHLPKVGKIKWVKDFYILPVEKLTPLTDTQIIKNLRMISNFIEKERFNDLESLLSTLDSSYSDISKLMEDINLTFGDSDFTTENFMMRNNTVVITDPIKFYDSSYGNITPTNIW